MKLLRVNTNLDTCLIIVLSTLLNMFQKPGQKGMGQAGWNTQAKLQMSLWLGPRTASGSIRQCLEALPRGFVMPRTDRLPTHIEYTGQ